MDTVTDKIEALSDAAKETARAAYRRGLRDARDAVARLTDGDSDIHDAIIVEACAAIEELTLPDVLK